MSDTFAYHGEVLRYFDHMYNLTMLNERRVELAIANRWLEDASWRTTLEVGNVTGHYSQRFHTVVDRDEKAAWYQDDGYHGEEKNFQQVINKDIVEWARQAPRKYEHVLSISTIEHTDDPIMALDVLQSLVAPGGKLLVTFPTGAHPTLDQYVRDGALGLTRSCTLARGNERPNEWWQTPEPEIREYGPWANSVFIGEWERPA